MSAFLLALLGRNGTAARVGRYLRLIEEKENLIYLCLITCTLHLLVGSLVVTAHNLLLGSLTANLIVADAVANHVHAHIRRTLVRVLTIDTLEESVENRIYLDITVIVDSHLAVSVEMERVNHIHIVEVGGSCLVGDVDRVLEREIPYWECLELGISGTHPALVLII